MSEIENIFGKDILKQICAEVGDTDEQEVARVLESVLPQLHEEYDNGNVAQRAAAMQQEPERGLGAAALLPLLLGGGAASQAAQLTGVSQKKTGSILKVAAPILLAYLFKKKVSQSQQQSQLQQLQHLQQAQNPQGAGLLNMLFGGQQAQNQQAQLHQLQQLQQLQHAQQAQHHQNQQGAGLFNALFGGQQQQQSGGDLLGGLLSMLGGRSMPTDDGKDK